MTARSDRHSPRQRSGLRNQTWSWARITIPWPWGFGSLDPIAQDRSQRGDDNAPEWPVIQVAARLAVSPPARTVVFIAFSGRSSAF